MFRSQARRLRAFRSFISDALITTMAEAASIVLFLLVPITHNAHKFPFVQKVAWSFKHEYNPHTLMAGYRKVYASQSKLYCKGTLNENANVCDGGVRNVFQKNGDVNLHSFELIKGIRPKSAFSRIVIEAEWDSHPFLPLFPFQDFVLKTSGEKILPVGLAIAVDRHLACMSPVVCVTDATARVNYYHFFLNNVKNSIVIQGMRIIVHNMCSESVQ
jgi:hypothetical protein